MKLTNNPFFDICYLFCYSLNLFFNLIIERRDQQDDFSAPFDQFAFVVLRVWNGRMKVSFDGIQ